MVASSEAGTGAGEDTAVGWGSGAVALGMTLTMPAVDDCDGGAAVGWDEGRDEEDEGFPLRVWESSLWVTFSPALARFRKSSRTSGGVEGAASK